MNEAPPGNPAATEAWRPLEMVATHAIPPGWDSPAGPVKRLSNCLSLWDCFSGCSQHFEVAQRERQSATSVPSRLALLHVLRAALVLERAGMQRRARAIPT